MDRTARRQPKPRVRSTSSYWLLPRLPPVLVAHSTGLHPLFKAHSFILGPSVEVQRLSKDHFGVRHHSRDSSFPPACRKPLSCDLVRRGVHHIEVHTKMVHTTRRGSHSQPWYTPKLVHTTSVVHTSLHHVSDNDRGRYSIPVVVCPPCDPVRLVR